MIRTKLSIIDNMMKPLYDARLANAFCASYHNAHSKWLGKSNSVNLAKYTIGREFPKDDIQLASWANTVSPKPIYGF